MLVFGLTECGRAKVRCTLQWLHLLCVSRRMSVAPRQRMTCCISHLPWLTHSTVWGRACGLGLSSTPPVPECWCSWVKVRF